MSGKTSGMIEFEPFTGFGKRGVVSVWPRAIFPKIVVVKFVYEKRREWRGHITDFGTKNNAPSFTRGVFPFTINNPFKDESCAVEK